MSQLHIYGNRGHTMERLTRCLALMENQDLLLLVGDGLYCLESETNTALSTLGERLYYLLEDATARHIQAPGFGTAIDYPGFVTLCLDTHHSISW